jgi:hypothetical protein
MQGMPLSVMRNNTTLFQYDIAGFSIRVNIPARPSINHSPKRSHNRRSSKVLKYNVILKRTEQVPKRWNAMKIGALPSTLPLQECGLPIPSTE